MPDQHTLEETERAVSQQTGHLPLDFTAAYSVQTIYRAANAVRERITRTVLRPQGLTWTGFLVLWVVWIWQERESHEVADSVGITKATLTGVVKTLQTHGWMSRTTHPEDGRRVLLTLTPEGIALMERIYPLFNAEESRIMAGLRASEQTRMTNLLRQIVTVAEED